MNRIEELPQNALVADIKQMGLDIDQLKQRQFMGFDVTTIQTNQTANVTDRTVPGSDGIVFDVDFTADNQQFPSSQVRFNVTRGNTTTLADPDSYDILIQDDTFTSVGVSSFLINVFNNEAGTLYIKVYVLSTDVGEVVIT